MMKKLLYLVIPFLFVGCYQSSKLDKSTVAALNHYKIVNDSLQKQLLNVSVQIDSIATLIDDLMKENENKRTYIESLSQRSKSFKYYFERTKMELDSVIAENKNLNLKIIEQEKIIEQLKKK